MRQSQGPDPPRPLAVPRLGRPVGAVLRGLGIVVLAMAGAVLVRKLLLGTLGTRIVWVTFYPAVIIASLYGGWVTGLASAAASALIAVAAWPVLADQPFIKDQGDWIGVGAFLANSAMIAAVAEAARRARDRALVARDQAEAANRAKSAFLASMSHELRTPLNAILGITQLMRTDPSATLEQRKTLDIINRSGQHLLGLINDVLDLAKVESGRAVVLAAPFNPRTLVDDVAILMRQRAEAKGLRLDVVIPPDLPPAISADEGKLRQVLLNLVGNAVKFTARGGITLRVAHRALEDGRRVTLTFEIQDTGPGIPRDDRERIFEPFVQLAHESDQVGTGLGLGIARQFVQLMGGSIAVESDPGTGSTFRIDVPAEVTDAPSALRASPGEERLAHLAPGQPACRILIVEDHAENWRLLKALLERAGFQVQVAENGAEGVQAFEAWRPHFIWMDWRMPVLGGAEATRRIRRLEGGREVKIVALSASVFQEERDQVLASGVDEFVPKPIQFDRIFECLSRQLGVKLVYDELPPTVPRDSEAGLDRDAIASLPPSLRAEMEASLVSLDPERIAGTIRRVSVSDPALARALEPLAERFQYTTILRALQACRDDAAAEGPAR
jgi:signal transduction histidine kinase/CheY-like chemotaxis protein